MDKRRAQKMQLKKREDISDVEESNKRRGNLSPLSRTPLSASNESRKPSSLLSSTPAPPGSVTKKRKKRGKVSVAKHVTEEM